MKDRLILRFMFLVFRALEILLQNSLSNPDTPLKETASIIAELRTFMFQELKKGG